MHKTLIQRWLKVHAQPPSPLFHYTTAEGLLSILESRHIWATDSKYLNDPTELTYAVDLMRELIESELRATSDHKRHEVADYIDKILEEKQAHARVFIACFCADGDLLSQWRGYGGFGGGYSIGFDPQGLFGVDPRDRPPWRVLRRVIYEPNQQRQLLRDWLNTLCQPGTDLKQHLTTDNPTLLTEWLVSFKDPSYQEESEWRLIQFGREFDMDAATGETSWEWPAKVRARNGQLVLFADFDLSSPSPGLGASPLIPQVVLGPTVQVDRARDALEIRCKVASLPIPEVRESRVPFVP